MRTKLPLAVVMSLMIGSAVAGGIMLKDDSRTSKMSPAAASRGAHEVTPEMIAKWKLTAATSDYSPPMLPI
jgi:hypothetical protein